MFSGKTDMEPSAGPKRSRAQRRLRKDVDDELDAIVLKTLAKSPSGLSERARCGASPRGVSV